MEAKNEVLQSFAKRVGAVLFGVADTKRMCKELQKPSFPFLHLPFALSIALPLSNAVIESLTDAPTLLYAHHYKQLNYALDRIALSIVHFIQERGYNAVAVPASQITDWERVRGDISHKRVAHYAGLGWIGRSSLLVTKEFGARIRLVSVFTDMPLSASEPAEGWCESCVECVKTCPAAAIEEDGLLLQKCLSKLNEFRKRGIGQYICGICQKACRGQST